MQKYSKQITALHNSQLFHLNTQLSFVN